MTTATAEQRRLSVGLHAGIPAHEYHALDACNNSSLNTLRAHSPLHCKYERDNPTEPTEAMIIGTALHTRILEPVDFNRIYMVSGPCDGVIKSGDRKGSRCGAAGVRFIEGGWYCRRHADDGDEEGIVLTQDQADMLDAMDAAVKKDPFCKSALMTAPEREMTAMWEDAFTHQLCKARFDALGRKHGIIVDIKTTTDASSEAFTRTIYERGYFRQAAHYLDGAAALGITISDFVIIAVEKEAPYAVSFNRLTDEAIEAGQKELRPLMERYAHCQSLNLWPGYEPRDIGIPAWREKQIDNAL